MIAFCHLAAVLAFTMAVAVPLESSQAARRRLPAKRQPAAQASRAVARPPVNIGVVAFNQSAGESIYENLGQGIADTVTNLLKGVGTLSVADAEVLARAAAGHKQLNMVRDEDALVIARELGLNMLVRGSYAHSADRLLVDVRILNVTTAALVPGSAFKLDESFPAEYPALLRALGDHVVGSLKVPLTRGDTVRVATGVSTSRSAEAITLYSNGLAQLRDNTPAAVAAAIDLFGRAIQHDPAYALAYAAKAEAEGRLSEFREQRGQDASETVAQAVKNARSAVQINPRLAPAQRALARAYNIGRNYRGAASAARQAIELSPNDAAAKIDFNRAENGGKLVRSKDLDAALQLQPWVALIISHFPKVVVRNDSDTQVSATFTPDEGVTYPVLRVGPKSLRAIALFPGRYEVAFDCPAGELVRSYQFRANDDYVLDFNLREIVTTYVTVTNGGNAPAFVSFRGARWSRSLVVNPRGSERFSIQTGSYRVSCSNSGTGPPLRAIDTTLAANREFEFTCTITETRRTVYRRRPRGSG